MLSRILSNTKKYVSLLTFGTALVFQINSVGAYICADYVMLSGTTAIVNNDCQDITVSPRKQNPDNLRAEITIRYKDLLLSPLDMKIGGWVLSNNHEINRIWLNSHYNHSFTLSEKDKELLEKVSNKEYNHLRKDIYQEASVYLAKKVLSENFVSNAQKVIDQCSQFQSKDVCKKTYKEAFTNTISKVIESLLVKKPFDAYLTLQESQLQHIYDPSSETRLTQNIFGIHFFNKQGILKWLPFTKEDHSLPLQGIYNAQGDYQISLFQLKMIQKINSYRFATSELFRACFQNNCKKSQDQSFNALVEAKVEESAMLFEDLIKVIKLELSSPILSFVKPKSLKAFINNDSLHRFLNNIYATFLSRDIDSYFLVAEKMITHYGLIISEIARDNESRTHNLMKEVEAENEKATWKAAQLFSNKLDYYGFLPQTGSTFHRWGLLENVYVDGLRETSSNHHLTHGSYKKRISFITSLGVENSYQIKLIRNPDLKDSAFSNMSSDDYSSLNLIIKAQKKQTIDGLLQEIL